MPPTTGTTQSIFEALLESIIYQQLNGKVAATIISRVKALFRKTAGAFGTVADGWTHFPRPTDPGGV